MNWNPVKYKTFNVTLFIIGIYFNSFSAETKSENQKPDSSKVENITLDEKKYTLSDRNDSLASVSTIIIYHPAKLEGDFFYEVFINDSNFYDAVWGTADSIKVSSGKETEIKGKSVTEDVIHFIPARGKKYFIRCGLKKGFVRGKPILEFVEPAIAEKELSKIRK